MRNTTTIKNCKECGKEMSMPFWLSKRKEFCSKLCNGARVRRETDAKWLSVCLQCNKAYRKDHASLGSFCSRNCYWQSLRIYGEKPNCMDCGQKLTTHQCERCSECWAKYRVGDKHSGWKGDKVGYRALHSWVERQLGKPNRCSECGKIGYKQHHMHWANISQEYKRDTSDWLRLCVSCHKAFDAEKKLLVFNK